MSGSAGERARVGRWAPRRWARHRSAHNGRPGVAFSATCVHLPFSRAAAGVQSTSVEAVLSGRHERSNLQAVEGRSRIGSGFAWRRATDSQHSRQFPILPFKNRQPFDQITKRRCDMIFEPWPLPHKMPRHCSSSLSSLFTKDGTAKFAA